MCKSNDTAENRTGIIIDLSQAPPDRLKRAFQYLTDAMAKQPKSDFDKVDDKDNDKKILKKEHKFGYNHL